MPPQPEVSLAGFRHGIFEEAVRLNPRFTPGHPLLLATLDILWAPPDPLHAIAGLESNLLAFSPGFARHECRGEGIYHVFPGEGRRGFARPRSAREPGGADRQPFEAPLALAHLIEHAVIDFQAEVTQAGRLSGITAAHRSTPARFDVMVECRDPRVGRCCLLLAVDWLTAALAGEAPGRREREVLRVLRLSLRCDGRGLFAPRVAKRLGLREERAEAALSALEAADYLVRLPCTLNLSGCQEYRVARKAGEGPAPAEEERAGDPGLTETPETPRWPR